DRLRARSAGFPDLHVGVVSTDMGAGRYPKVPGCPSGGDRGALHHRPVGKNGTCTTTPRGAYIAASPDGSHDNFDGDIADVFACIAEIPFGCGFEQPLA